MSEFIYRLKQALLSLQNKQGFVATVVITMGTTLGALLCALTLGYLLIIEPLPYPEFNRLYTVNHAIVNKSGQTDAKAFTYPGLLHLYKNQDVFEQAALIQYGFDILTSSSKQPTLSTGYATPEWFKLLGVSMHLGRAFEATEALDTNNPVAILSHETWQQEFSGTPDILEQTISFRGVSFRIIGVLAKSFVEPRINRKSEDVSVWLPWDYNLDLRLQERWGSISDALTFVGKLKSDKTVIQAQQTLTPLINDKWIEKVKVFDFFTGWTVAIKLQSFQKAIVGESSKTVYLLIAGVFGLVLIAFTNIANLFMSRTAEQQRQLAIYAALGAKKSHLFRGLVTESGLLMAVSILIALVIASFGFYTLQQHLNTVLPRVSELKINTITFVSALFFASAFALLFAFLSSKMINYRALNSTLQSSGKGTGVQVSKRLRQTLIVTQVVITTLLVFTNISLYYQAVDQITKPTGYNIDNLIEMRLSISSPQHPAREQVAADMIELKKSLLALPQVEDISHTTSVMDGFGIWALAEVSTGQQFTPESTGASTNYFSMMGQSLIVGDYFSEADIRDENRVMIVNDVFAKRLQPEGSAIGMQLSNGPNDESFTIIGVVKGIKMPASEEIPIRVYTPVGLSTRVMTLKLKEGQSLSREQVVSVIKGVSNLYALFSLNKSTDVETRMLFTQYTTAIVTGSLALITLFLASIGLYGVLSYGTQMRRFELGTRMAIGAKRKHLLGLIISDNGWTIFLGMLISVFLMLGLYIAFQEALTVFVSIELIPIFLLTLISIIILSLFACYWPLRQYINHPAIHSLRGSD